MAMNVNEWINSSSAERFFQQEAKSFNNLSSMLCGQMGVQLSMAQQCTYLEDINVSSKFSLFQQDILIPDSYSSIDKTSSFSSSTIADLEALPFSSNQFAVVIVPQMNLFSVDPYAALREIYRVTASDGFIAISGINRWSLISLQAKCLPQKYPFLPTVSQGQMKVWLSLLGCDIISGDLFHYSAMTQGSGYPSLAEKVEKVGNRWCPMLSGGYWLVAKKRLFGHMLQKPNLKRRYNTKKMSGHVATNSNSTRKNN